MDSLGNHPQILRIQEMEKIFATVIKTFHEGMFHPEEDAEHAKMLRTLTDYYESPLWLEDYAADENGELPADLIRGVLSQDALYDLLTDIAEESVYEKLYDR